MKSPLTILNVAYPFAEVGERAVGGAEQIVAALDRALVAAGHHSLVAACEGSQVAGTLLATPKVRGDLTENLRAMVQRSHRRTIESALKRWPIDLVHFHGVDFHTYYPASKPPALVTLHLPIAWYPEQIFAPAFGRLFLQCVSDSQQTDLRARYLSLPVIENGVPIHALGAKHARRRFVLCLGRICPEKGFHLAFEAARLAGAPLLLAGELFRYPSHQKYFQKEILPRLDRQRRWIGPVGFVRKRRLLSAARCLLVPSLVKETSSLVAMEALACGTPVIASPQGALPEIIAQGVTGFLVRNIDEMAEAICNVGKLNPETCRATACQRFSMERMISSYFDLYQKLAAATSMGDDDFLSDPAWSN
jgi:glycosyltransferase involved in cell wall biosynthesis